MLLCVVWVILFQCSSFPFLLLFCINTSHFDCIAGAQNLDTSATLVKKSVDYEVWISGNLFLHGHGLSLNLESSKSTGSFSWNCDSWSIYEFKVRRSIICTIKHLCQTIINLSAVQLILAIKGGPRAQQPWAPAQAPMEWCKRILAWSRFRSA